MIHLGDDLKASALALIEGEPNWVANLANLSSLIYFSLPDLNWVGFYLWDRTRGELVLGPFQGRPACIRIKPGRGVCGTAFAEKKSLIVNDVTCFDGHIACDPNSRSELVIPILTNHNECVGVLDLDSPTVGRFTASEERLLRELTDSVIVNVLKSFETADR